MSRIAASADAIDYLRTAKQFRQRWHDTIDAIEVLWPRPYARVSIERSCARIIASISGYSVTHVRSMLRMRSFLLRLADQGQIASVDPYMQINLTYLLVISQISKADRGLMLSTLEEAARGQIDYIELWRRAGLVPTAI